MAFFQTKKNTNGDLEWERFPPYDIKAAEKRLNPEKRGNEFGTSDSKTEVKDDTQLTSPEIEMIADVNDHILQLSDWQTHITGEAKDAVIALTDDVDPDFSLGQIESTFKKKVNESLTKFKFDVDKIYTPWKNAYRRKNAFQFNHCIDNHREAEYPESKLFHFAILFLILFVESAANCFFFAKGAEYGLFGGFSTAVLISSANVIVSFIAGAFFLRQYNYVERQMGVSLYIRKFGAAAGFVASLCLLLVLHFAVAHHRELTNSVVGFQPIEALKHFFADPFGLNDILSLILILLGCGISVVGICDGYTIDDRFPRYGEVCRTWKDIDDTMAFHRKAFRMRISDHYNEAVDSSHQIMVELKNGKKQLEKIQGKINALLTSCVGYYDQASNGAISLINIFRNTVQQIYNDPNCFPYTEKLLTSANGLKKIDFSKSRDDVEGLLLKTIDHFNALEKDFPAKQDDLLNELEMEQADYLDEAAIDSMIQQIKERRDQQSAEMDESKPSADFLFKR